MAIRRATSYGYLGAGIIAISFASIFIRLADAPTPLVAALRMAFASLFIAPVALSSSLFRREMRMLTGRDMRLLLLSGFMLSLHFLLWIASLARTDVASSVVFVTTNPLFVALYSMIVHRERMPAAVWAGLSLAIVGSLVLGWNDLRSGGAKWEGDCLAVLGSIAVAGYFLVGSRLRAKLSLISYVFPVYAISAVVLAIVLLAVRIPLTAYGWRTYLFIGLMALVCQLFGHSVFNWALKHLRATVVTIGVLGEPVGATLLALLLLGESPGIAKIIGGGCIIAGIFVVLSFGPETARPRP